MTFYRQIVRAGRHFGPTWRYGFNLAPTLAYRFGDRSLSGEATRVVGDLNVYGMAVTSVDALLESRSCYEELGRTVDDLEDALAGRLAAARADANDTGAVGRKTFNIELLGGRPVLDPESVYARFALQNPILQIANAYFGMLTRLRYYNVWHTFATRGAPRESQLWHRDREDHFILKVFVYLSDVGESAGPFTYATGSHMKRKLTRTPAYSLEGCVRRSTDEQMAEVVPRERWTKGTGPRGTIVFADTHGYHKGGLARASDRLMYTCMFTSQASQSQQLFEVPRKLSLPAGRELSFALSMAK
ncbi:MAG: hypothetical protein ACRD68_05530 [Pyrinomonadaceae bacterium]